jgi:hypothetical protein
MNICGGVQETRGRPEAPETIDTLYTSKHLNVLT